MSTIDEIEATFELVKKGDQKLQLKNELRDVVLILGNTGSGKSTFTQWIAGYNSKLIAKKIGSSILIEDGNNKIGSSTLTSKTELPELVVDSVTNTAYYDCPGFGDTRSISYDLSSAYFIKEVIDYSHSVKIIFTVNYDSVLTGDLNKDFSELLKYVNDLVKDTAKFKDSIAIVLTKVGKDDDAINKTVRFLQKTKSRLHSTIRNQTILHNAINFIESLLIKNVDGDYSRIGLFSRPTTLGPLSEIPSFQEEKKNIKVLVQNLQFIPKISSDFGHVLSQNTKNYITDTVEKINRNMLTDVNKISTTIKNFLQNLFDKMQAKLNSLVESTAFIDVTQTKSQVSLDDFNRAHKAISDLDEELSNLKNVVEFVEKVKKGISRMADNLAVDEISDLEKQKQYLEFLQSLSNDNLNSQLPNQFLKNLLRDGQELGRKIQKLARKVANDIFVSLKNTSKAIEERYDEKIKSLEIQRAYSELKKEYDMMYKVLEKINNSLKLEANMLEVYGDVNSLGLSLDQRSIQIAANAKQYFSILKNLTNQDPTPKIWPSPFNEIVNRLNESQKWYQFLTSLYSKFSEYSFQRDKTRYDVHDLNQWGNSRAQRGLKIDKNNYKVFLTKIAGYKITGYDNLKNITLSEFQLQELNDVLNITIKSKIEITCLKPYITVKGNFISVNEIISDADGYCNDLFTKEIFQSKETFTGSESFQYVNLFSLNTIFIDEDLKINSRFTLSIIAPTWQIIGNNRIIDLTGDTGKSFYKKADLEVEGKPGGAGGPGGNFFGIGKNFTNGKKMIVSVNGGVGGLGQNGGDGKAGSDGFSVPLINITPETCSFITKYKNIYSNNGYDFKNLGCPTDFFGSLSGIVKCRYQIFGKIGENGSNGKSGGKGGKGGKSGNFILVELKNNSEIRKDIEIGNNGKASVGGKGGKGGFQGSGVEFVCKTTESKGVALSGLFQPPKKTYELEDSKIIYENRIQSPDGSVGITGANNKNMEEPKPVLNLDDQTKAKILREYEIYLTENLSDRSKKYLLTEFLNELSNSKDLKNLHTLNGFVNKPQENVNLNQVNKNFKRTKRNQENISNDKKASYWSSWLNFPSLNFFGAEAVVLEGNSFPYLLKNLMIDKNIKNEKYNPVANSPDILGNLSLLNLITHKIFGTNKSLGTTIYTSPEERQSMRINKLASEILPIQNFSHNVDYFIGNCNNDMPQWYQDLITKKQKNDN